MAELMKARINADSLGELACRIKKTILHLRAKPL